MTDDWCNSEQLHIAAEDGDLSRVTLLLSQGCLPNALDELGRTPLHYAVEKEHFDVVSILLAHGADVNAHDEASGGDTPLAQNAQTCTLKMAELLLKAGANPTIRGLMQLNAVDRAGKRKRGDGPRIYRLLCDAAARL